MFEKPTEKSTVHNNNSSLCCRQISSSFIDCMDYKDSAVAFETQWHVNKLLQWMNECTKLSIEHRPTFACEKTEFC